MKAAQSIEVFLEANRQTILKEISASLGVPPDQVDSDEIMSVARSACLNADVRNLTGNQKGLRQFFRLIFRELDELGASPENSDSAELFLKRNEDLIYALASRVLGPSYSKDISLSVAFLAYRKAAKLKRDQFQKTKLTTVFFWWFLKELHAIRGIDGREMPDVRGKGEKRESLKGLDFQRLSFGAECFEEGSAGQLQAGSQTVGDLLPSPPDEFHVCLLSFRSRLSSKDLMDTLQLLYEGAQKGPAFRSSGRTDLIDEIRAKFGGKRLDSMSRRLIAALYQQVRTAGAHIYKAECLNGTHATVIVCAADQAEAYRYLSRYGKVLSCRILEAPR
ncbi:MAG: hypothetical protein U0411_09440 [Thermodesulfovibrionales bacterium]